MTIVNHMSCREEVPSFLKSLVAAWSSTIEIRTSSARISEVLKVVVDVRVSERSAPPAVPPKNSPVYCSVL